MGEPEAADYLEELERLSSGTPDEEVRLVLARANVAFRTASIEGVLASTRTDATPGRARVEPLTVSYFFATYAYVLTLRAQYREALQVVRAGEAYAKRRGCSSRFRTSRGLPLSRPSE